jgi:hypothetical protein
MKEEYTTKTGVNYSIQYSGLLARLGDYYSGLFIIEDDDKKRSAIKIKIGGTLLHAYFEVARGDDATAEKYLKEIGLTKIKIALERNDLPFFSDQEIIEHPRDYDREFVFLAPPQKISYEEQIKKLGEELDIFRK